MYDAKDSLTTYWPIVPLRPLDGAPNVLEGTGLPAPEVASADAPANHDLQYLAITPEQRFNLAMARQ